MAILFISGNVQRVFTIWQGVTATMAVMTHALALIAKHSASPAEELLRTAMVIGCAMALILAGRPLPL